MLGRGTGRVLNRLPFRLRTVLKEELYITHRLDYAGASIKMVVDGTVGVQRLYACTKEPETVAWIEASVRPGNIFYDIGANVGAYALVAAHVMGKGKVYAFEPSFSTFSRLCENILINGRANSIVPLFVALTDRETIGMSFFDHSSIVPGGSMHTVQGNASVPGALSSPVPSCSLDAYVALLHLPHPTHIKIDVDGGELPLVQGAARTLALSSVRSVLIEINERHSDTAAIKAILQNAGFEVYAKYARAAEGTFNYIFNRQRAV